MTRSLRIRYSVMGNIEFATISTADGWAVCSVEQALGEGQRRFRQRAQSLRHALECCPHPMITLSPTEC